MMRLNQFKWMTCIFFFAWHTVHATSLYQVDLVIFKHPIAAPSLRLPPLVFGLPRQAVTLGDSNGQRRAYQRLPESASHLTRQTALLRTQLHYPILGHYSWLQPAHAERPIALNITYPNGTIKGTFLVRQSNYYLLNTELLFTSTLKGVRPFVFTQQQRIKPNTVYYLDHPQVGMLLKIHAV